MNFLAGVTRILPFWVALQLLPAVAAAQVPIAEPGTEGFELIVQSTDTVVATYQGNSASFSNDLYLMLDESGNPGDDSNPVNDLFIFNNHASPVGSTVPLGAFPVGTKLIFRLHVNNTGIDYFTGPGSRNPDGQPHARAQAGWMPNETLVSFEDLLNGPFHYNDLSFSFANTVSACNPTLRELCGANAQLTYPMDMPPPQDGVDTLVVVIHGCCTPPDPEDKNIAIWKDMASSLQAPGRVIWLYNWQKDAGPDASLFSALTAYKNAVGHGKYLGTTISVSSYKYVHFIGHSAGSNLIHHAIKTIKANSNKLGLNDPTIHATFLDAFTPSIQKFFYGEDLEEDDYAEHYVDFGLPATAASLSNAYNFDITRLDHSLDDSGLFGHDWPIHWYQQSIDTPGEYGFGFPRSFEYSNVEDPSNFYVSLKQSLQSQLNISAGGLCVLTSKTECIPNPNVLLRPIISYAPLLGSWITGGAEAIRTSISGVVETIDDNVRGWLSTLFTGSPVWLEAPITTPQSFNLLKFDYEFLSAAGAQGIMTVFVDDQLVYTIDERITDPGINTALDIPIGELTPGTHTIGVRLDPYTAVQSVVRISNIEFGEVVDTPIPGMPNLQPTEITFDPSTAVVGGSVFFDSGVRNTGDVDAGVFNIKWFVNDQEVGAYGSHAGVPAGQTVLDDNSQFSWTFDSPGTYSVTFTVDVDNHIEESNEEDNSTTIDVVVAQASAAPEIERVETFREGVLVFFRAFFTDPNNDAEGFGFRWFPGEETHPFSDPSHGRVSPGTIEYPFNLGCGTGSEIEFDVEVWIYDSAGLVSPSVTVHLACHEAGQPPTPTSCTELFGSAPEFVLCEETETTCSFNARMDGGTCDQMCASLGSTCVGAINNGESCEELPGSNDTCETSRSTEICICERPE